MPFLRMALPLLSLILLPVGAQEQQTSEVHRYLAAGQRWTVTAQKDATTVETYNVELAEEPVAMTGPASDDVAWLDKNIVLDKPTLNASSPVGTLVMYAPERVSLAGFGGQRE